MLNLEHLLAVAQAHQESLKAEVASFAIGTKFFDFNQAPALMGVINLSPDSWYRESVCLSADQAIQRGMVLAAQGAHLIDIGAESTLAHASRVRPCLQSGRLLPVVSALASERVAVSVETYEPEVAKAALEAGAAVINFTGQKTAEPVYRLVAEHDAALIICHVQGENVREVGDLQLGADPIPDLLGFFEREIDKATVCGVRRIFIDPGLGFYYSNLQDSAERVRFQALTFLNTFRLRSLGWPVCHVLPHAFEFFAEEVRSAEPFFAVLAALGRTDLIRTHEVARVKGVLDTMQACG